MPRGERWERGGTAVLALALLSGAGVLSYRVLEPPEPWSSPIRFVDSAGPPPATSRDLAPVSGPRSAAVRLGFVGDVMQHRRQAGDDFRRSYAAIAPLVQGFDLAVANLEFPVDPASPVGPPPRSVAFNGSPAHLDALAAAGFDLAGIANNHVWDQGARGVAATAAEVTRRGIEVLGVAAPGESVPAPVLRTAGGIRLAFLAYTFWPNPSADSAGGSEQPPRDLPVGVLHFSDWTDEFRSQGLERMRADAARARAAGAEFVVAFVHWGQEWRLQPSADQRAAGHDFVDAGFDLVVGSHPHVLEPPESYRGRLIAYSLGNLITDFAPLPARTGAVLEVEVERMRDSVRVVRFRYYPTLVVRPGHRVTPVHAADAGQSGEAWRLARRIAGPEVLP